MQELDEANLILLLDAQRESGSSASLTSSVTGSSGDAIDSSSTDSDSTDRSYPDSFLNVWDWESSIDSNCTECQEVRIKYCYYNCVVLRVSF